MLGSVCGQGWEARKLVMGEWSQVVMVSTGGSKEGEKMDSGALINPNFL